MRGLTTLVAGAVLSNSLYAAEPSLHTTPDPGVPLVQENADKALKVAYMVLGGMCPSLNPNDTIFNKLMTKEDIVVQRTTIVDNGQVIYVVATDYFVETKTRQQDYLSIGIYPPDISLEEAKRGKGSLLRAINIVDVGLDGHANEGNQQYYLSTLDKIIVACEGTKQ